jgi:hypothetical protein
MAFAFRPDIYILEGPAVPNTDEGQRKPRGEAGASPKEKTSRGTLDAPILSQRTNQASADRVGARPARGPTTRRAGAGHSAPPGGSGVMPERVIPRPHTKSWICGDARGCNGGIRQKLAAGVTPPRAVTKKVPQKNSATGPLDQRCTTLRW